MITMMKPMLALDKSVDIAGLAPMIPGRAPDSLVPQLEQKTALSSLSALHLRHFFTNQFSSTSLEVDLVYS
jgi:hypothetical protein